MPARVTEKTGPVSYQCELEDGRIIRMHIDHLRLRHQHTSDRVIRKDHTNTPKKDSVEGREDEEFTEGTGLTRDIKRSDVGLDHENTLPKRPEEEGATEQNEPLRLRSPEIQDKPGPGERDKVGVGDNSNPANETSLRRSSRIRKAPNRLDL